MKFLNHYKMASLIWESMASNDMQLRRRVYFLGNVAPDLIGSFLFRQHSYITCGARLRKLLRRLFDGNVANSSILFSFYTGVISHYVCDFLCYAHTTAFMGSVREHYKYEKSQNVNAEEMLPFYKQKSMNYSYSELKLDFESCIARRERILSQNGGMSAYDIPFAVYVATWAVSAVYLRAEYINEIETMPSALLSA